MEWAKGRIATTAGYALAATALASLTLSPLMAAAAEVSDESAEAVDSEKQVSNQTTNAATAKKKDETVYVYLQPDGTVKSAEVSDKLSNPDGHSELSDSSTLTEIENVEGSESYSGSGQNMVWGADGNDIYYRGTTTAEAPVKVKVSYKLDGASVAPAELAGKSGHVVIRYDYVNTSKTEVEIAGEKETVTTPFVAFTAMLLDGDVFSNVQVENGKVIDDGDRTVAVGYAMPGLADSLKLTGEDFEDVDVPEHFQVEADVTDFELKSTLTIVSPNLFDDMDLDFDTDELTDASAELKDAIGALEDGTGELVDGLKALADGARSAKDGSGKLVEGANAVSDGASQVADGTSELKDKTSALPEGISALASGASILASGLDKAVAGIGTSKDSSSKTLYGGVNQLYAGLSQLEQGFGGDSDTGDSGTLIGGINGVTEALSAADQYLGSMGDMKTALEDLASASASLKTNAADLKKKAGGMEQVSAAVESAAAGAKAAAEKVTAAKGALDGIGATATISGKDEALKALNSINMEGMKDEQKNAISKAITAIDGVNATAEVTGKQNAEDAMGEAEKAAGTSADTIVAVGEKLGGASSALSAIQTDLTNVQTALGSISADDQTALKSVAAAQLYVHGAAAAMPKLKAGAAEARDALSNQVLPGVKGLQGGLDTLLDSKKGLPSAASGAHTIASNLASMKESMPELVKGIESLASGAATLAKGSVTLAAGTLSLDKGLDKLADGAKSAAEGGSKLAEGVQQFDDEGISEITDLIDDKLMKFLDRYDAVVDAGRAYTNFSGIADGTEGSVKFIYETDAISLE